MTLLIVCAIALQILSALTLDLINESHQNTYK